MERPDLLRKIFVYHGLSLNDGDGLKEVWWHDLENFTTNEIKCAWDEWRGVDVNQNKKPKPYDLVKIMRRKRGEKMIPENKPDVLVKGKDLGTDLLIEGLERMKANMPDYEERMKECKYPYEKLLIGLSALNINPDRRSEMMSIFKKVMHPNA
jgi:hypothetical protein